MGTLKEAEALLQEQMNAAGAEQAAQKAASRDSRIVRASAIGILANVVLIRTLSASHIRKIKRNKRGYPLK